MQRLHRSTQLWSEPYKQVYKMEAEIGKIIQVNYKNTLHISRILKVSYKRTKQCTCVTKEGELCVFS
jgi:hypothetical protein